MRVSSFLLCLAFSCAVVLVSPTVVKQTIVGGWSPVVDDQNDETLQEVKRFAQTEINKKHNGLYLLRIARFLDGQKQIVSGVMYRLTLLMKPTVCSNRDTNADLEHCDFNENGRGQVCTADVWLQSWLQDPKERIKLSKLDCKNEDN